MKGLIRDKGRNLRSKTAMAFLLGLTLSGPAAEAQNRELGTGLAGPKPTATDCGAGLVTSIQQYQIDGQPNGGDFYVVVKVTHDGSLRSATRPNAQQPANTFYIKGANGKGNAGATEIGTLYADGNQSRMLSVVNSAMLAGIPVSAKSLYANTCEGFGDQLVITVCSDSKDSSCTV